MCFWLSFQKFWELAKQVSEFMTWKKVECPFEKDRKILQYLLTAPAFTEDGAFVDHFMLYPCNPILLKM